MAKKHVAEMVAAISERVYDLVAPEIEGLPPQVQAAVLADLTAIWLAGHSVPGDAAASEALREKLLAGHIECVQRLVTVNVAMLYEREHKP